MMGVLNFAHASVYMLGAYFAYEVSRHVGFCRPSSSRPSCAARSVR